TASRDHTSTGCHSDEPDHFQNGVLGIIRTATGQIVKPAPVPVTEIHLLAPLLAAATTPRISLGRIRLQNARLPGVSCEPARALTICSLSADGHRATKRADAFMRGARATLTC